MNKNEQNRLVAWRLKLLRQASDMPRGVGVTEDTDHIWLISFMHYDLGFFDSESGRVECAPNPFDAKVSPMCPV